MRSLSCLALGAMLVAIPSGSQNVNPSNPVEIHAQKHLSPEEMRERFANVELQKDAKELAELCASVPPDMDGVKHGVLSKDVLEKLKRVEKLSKRVREQLTRISAAP